MRNSEAATSQPVGLDIGTSRIVVARNSGARSTYEAQLNAFVTLPYSKFTESLMVQENVFHEVQGSEFVVAGNDAQKFAEVLHVETRRPMLNGVLNPREPHGLQVVRRIVARLVGPAETPGQKICFSVPAPVDGDAAGVAYHEAMCRNMLIGLGYQPAPIEEGLAVVFGELGSSNYTGIGISCGSGLCNVCLAVLSLPVVSFSVAKAGDFIDARAAAATGERATRLRVAKESFFALNGLAGDRIQNALTVFYEDMIGGLVECLRARFSSASRLPKLDQSIPMVLSGGTAMPTGFLDRFKQAIGSGEFPVPVSDVRLSTDPLNATARGALMAALC